METLCDLTSLKYEKSHSQLRNLRPRLMVLGFLVKQKRISFHKFNHEWCQSRSIGRERFLPTISKIVPRSLRYSQYSRRALARNLSRNFRDGDTACLKRLSCGTRS